MSDYSDDDNVAENGSEELLEACADEAQPPKETVGDTKPQVLRDPVTGKFLAGTKAGPGRPKGLKDKLNIQVIETLEALWTKRGAEIVDQLAAEKPEVVMAMISRMIPQSLAAEAITGEKEGDKSNNINDIRITLVNKQDEPALPAREVEGELLPPDDVVH